MERLHRAHLLYSALHLFQLLILSLSLSSEAFVFLYCHSSSLHLLPISLILLIPIVNHLLFSRRRTIYLLDFSCLRPPPTCRVPTASLFEHLSLINCFDADSVAFMMKIMASSGIGEETCLPTTLRYIPPSTALSDCLEESRTLLFPTLDDLFTKTQVRPTDVDVVVVNCSGFCPAPSLSALVVKHYAMRKDVKSFNISGMGCGAGAIGIDVASTALRSGSLRFAVVLSTEIISTGWYAGKDRRKLLLNCSFRMGCSAVMLGCGSEEKSRAKYRLIRLLRTQRAFDDRAYRSAIREEDEEGITGFSIERDLLRVAAEILKANVAALGATILPMHERLRYVVMSMWRAGTKGAAGAVRVDWRKAIQHFCLPASGRTVMEEIAKGLGVGEVESEAARMTFHRFGNQSSASMWYQLAYEEAKGRVEVGERVWQLAMGSGPKCNSLVWECLRRPGGEAEKGPWAASITGYQIDSGGRRP